MSASAAKSVSIQQWQPSQLSGVSVKSQQRNRSVIGGISAAAISAAAITMKKRHQRKRIAAYRNWQQYHGGSYQPISISGENK